MKEDEHLQSFLAIPGKDNGFDIEGLAVSGEQIFLRLRGPVLRGWALILEVILDVDLEQPATLTLKPIGLKERLYQKHFLDLGGLDIQDLAVQGADLLILAGPSMDLDGSVTLVRWPGGIAPEGESMVSAAQLQQVMKVLYGHGDDYPEDITLFAPDGGTANSVLVVYDSASVARHIGDSTVAADVFLMPATSVKKT